MAGAAARISTGIGNYAKADRSLNKLYNQNGLKVATTLTQNVKVSHLY